MGDDPITLAFVETMPRSESLHPGMAADCESQARQRIRYRLALELAEIFSDGRLYEVRMTETIQPPALPISGPTLHVKVEVRPMERMPRAPEGPDWRPNEMIPEDHYS